jgi:hypothetical protein
MLYADFWMGRGDGARWLGTVCCPGGWETAHEVEPWYLDNEYSLLSRDGNELHTGVEYLDGSYLSSVEDILANATIADQAWHPNHDSRTRRAWPHGYPTSEGSDWAYAYQAKAIYVFQFGRLHSIHYPNLAGTKTEKFPTMETT